MIGKWNMMYFGFTHCPDICPEELDKMSDAVDMIEKVHGDGCVLPVFVSVDPARDSVEQVKRYVAGEFGFKSWNHDTTRARLTGRIPPPHDRLDGRL